MKERKKIISRVGITGASGNIGTTLTKGLSEKYTLILYDRLEIQQHRRKRVKSIVVDLSNAEEVRGIFNGLDAVIHLAADANPRASWESVLKNNIVVTYNVFEESRRAGVRRIVFASTNHVQHGYTIKTAPNTLDTSFYTERRGPITLSDPPAPDSLYAVSKLFGEDLGRYYARKSGMQFVALRIGWTIPEDDPSTKMGTPAEDYMRAMFLSKSDCIKVFKRALKVDMDDGDFLLAYAVSNNDRRVFELAETRETLGFNPEDNAENYF